MKIDVNEMKSATMCDKATRTWCCRIGLVFSISIVLLTMMIQIWSYYFSLVREMDTLSSAEPRLGALLSVCNNTVEKSWNIDCTVSDNVYMCSSSSLDKNVYMLSTCCENIDLKDLGEMRLSGCCRLMFWILPW